MRNLKRALSLLLSSTMVLGMLVMGGSAAGYQDVDDSNKNQEAIEVLQAVGIMTGDQNGNFNPDGSITRNEMAVIMAHLLNLDYDYYRGTNPFTDVPDWAAPYVAACAAEGVVAGIGNGQFGGDQKVTAAQASLMIMKALGYFENAEDFGSDWQVATIRQASYINLFDQINASAESALTRGQVAQLVLNGLQAKTVYFTGDKGIQIGDVTVGYRAEYTPKTGTDKKYNTLVSGKTDISEQGQYYIQLGEELYEGQLRKAPDADEFDRPAFTWSYKAQKIGTYVDWSLLVKEYTTAVTGEDLYNTLTSSAIKAYDFAYYVDGKTSDVIKASNMIRTNTKDYTTTGNGVLTQVFVDNEEEEITITSINTFLAQATADYNAKKDTLTIDVFQDKDVTKYNINKTLSGNDFDIADYKEGDMLRVCVAENAKGDYDVITIADPEVLSDSTVTKFSDKNYLVTDGTQYDYAVMGDAQNDLGDYYDSLLDNTYNIYLDAYGYVLGTVKVTGELKYLFLTGYDLNGSNLSVKTADGAAIFLDGTMSEIKIDVTDTDTNLDVNAKGETDGVATDPVNYPFLKTGKMANNQAGDSEYNMWFSYTVDKDGVYTLKPVANFAIEAAKADPYKINSASVRVVDQYTGSKTKYAYGNDDSVYITVDTGVVDLSSKTGITKVTGTYTGVQNVDIKVESDANNALTGLGYIKGNSGYPNASGAIYALYDEDLYIIGAVVIGEDANSTENYAFAVKGTQNEYKDADGYYYWDFVAVTENEVKTLTVKEKGTTVLKDRINNSILYNENAMYKLTYDTDGYVIGAELCQDKDANVYGGTEFNASTKIDPNTHKVYDVRHSYEDAQLMAIGRTLYVSNKTAKDVGLTIDSGATIVVIQREDTVDGAILVEEYTTFAQAIDALEDSIPGTEVVDFKGEISAVLNDKGTAEYVVLKSVTPENVVTDDNSTPVQNFAKVSMDKDGTVTLQDKDGKTVSTLTSKTDYSYVLYMRGPGQEGYEVAQSGTLNVSAGIDNTTLKSLVPSVEGASFYISVNDIASSPVLVPVTK